MIPSPSTNSTRRDDRVDDDEQRGEREREGALGVGAAATSATTAATETSAKRASTTRSRARSAARARARPHPRGGARWRRRSAGGVDIVRVTRQSTVVLFGRPLDAADFRSMTTSRLTRAALAAAGALAASAALAAPAHAGVARRSRPTAPTPAHRSRSRRGATRTTTSSSTRHFEDGAAGWKLNGGARVVAGNAPQHVHGAATSLAAAARRLDAPSSPPVCVGHDEPTLRFFARGTAAASTLAVAVQVQLFTGDVGDAADRRRPRRRLAPVARHARDRQPTSRPAGQYTAVRFVFTPLLGAAGRSTTSTSIRACAV